jgi:hypothetical protein
MAFAPSTPVTGGPQTGLTSPTYTIAAATAPVPNAKRYTVTALGGTQTGVGVHEISKPFDMTCYQPTQYKLLGTPNPVTGVVANVANNNHAVVVRRGVVPASGQNPRICTVKILMDCPAGAETYDAVNVRAALSLAFGAAWAQSAGLGDMCVSGTM